jgi:alanine racemase
VPRPILATIDLSALRHNLSVARRHAGGSRVLAVIKANAYGHGLERCARALAEADGYAILEMDYAVRLRDAGIDLPVLLLEGCFDPAELRVAARQRFMVAMHAPEQIDMLADLRADERVDVFLKLNTGMNRLGIRPDAFRAAMQRLEAHPGVQSLTLMTHFACADDERGLGEQLAVFERLCRDHPLPRSLANSATVLRFPEAHGDWVRPGIMLYGSSPFADVSAAALDLRPVMTLRSQVIGVQSLAAGEAVGYGATFVARQPTRIGIVACGYADGYPRHAPSGSPVLVEGERVATVGRVSMDMMCVDLTALPQAGVGSTVTLWGEGLPADEVAAAAGTISYEMFCALAQRVPVSELP